MSRSIFRCSASSSVFAFLFFIRIARFAQIEIFFVDIRPFIFVFGLDKRVGDLSRPSSFLASSHVCGVLGRFRVCSSFPFPPSLFAPVHFSWPERGVWIWVRLSFPSSFLFHSGELYQFVHFYEDMFGIYPNCARRIASSVVFGFGFLACDGCGNWRRALKH